MARPTMHPEMQYLIDVRDTVGEPLPRFAVRQADGLVVVDLPDLPPAMSMRETLLAAARAGRPT